MKTDLFSVSKIFTERLLRIPDFQRGFAWGEKQLKEYWNDLIQLEDNKNHYIGVLTLEDVPKNIIEEWTDDHWIIKAKSYAPFYVVDGQQRLTTTIILIQAITESIDNDTKLNFTSIEDIRRKYLFDSKDDGVSRSYIFGYEKDNPSYEYLKTNIFLENSESSYQAQETIYTHNLEFAKNYFIENLKNLSVKEIERIFTKITQNFLFNIYAISSDIDVFVAFETMNNRGKDLSHLELLKNRLIYLSTKFNVEDYEKVSLRKLINDCWKSIYHYLGKNKSNPLDDDLFLENHFLLYFGHILDENSGYMFRVRRLYRGYRYSHKDYLLETKFTVKNIHIAGEKNKNELSVNDIKSYAKSLKESVEIWYRILNPLDKENSLEERIWLERINRQGIESIAPLIMVFFQQEKNKKQRIKLLKAIERHLFFLYLVRYQHYMDIHPFMFIEIAVELSKKKMSPEKVINKIEQQLEKIKKDKKIIGLIKDSFRKQGFYKWKGIKYFLYEYDLSLKNSTKTERDKIVWENYIENNSDYHTVEHIYPQRPRKKCWTELYSHFSTKERSTLRHSLGNLVPLSRAKNSSFQNKCFSDKLGTKENKIGFKYGSYSENEIACNIVWAPTNIVERGISLLTFMEKRWDINLGDNAEKIRFLNLSFVGKKEKKREKKKT